MARVIFFNVGWMESYRGLNGDSIRGGGSFVGKNRYGHEMFNFLPCEGRMYGYAETKRINLQRLAGRPKANSVSDVLAIWVATKPYRGGTFIVGWYENATVYRESQEPTFAPNRKINQHITKDIRAVPADVGKYAYYIVSATADDCQLIPSSERTFRIPRGGRGDVGQRNLWYADSPDKTGFREQVVSYVRERTRDKERSRLDDLLKRKYGGGGEGIQHKSLKEWCANNPQAIGLKTVKRIPGDMEHRFICGDLADVVFEMHDSRYAVLEVETVNSEPGAHQALKYKTLLCAQKGFPVDSNRVIAILVAWQIPPSVRAFCDRYKIRYFEKRI